MNSSNKPQKELKRLLEPNKQKEDLAEPYSQYFPDNNVFLFWILMTILYYCSFLCILGIRYHIK